MVINQKNKYEMKHNLALFLGKISDDFVNWLFEHLSKLKQSSSDNSIDRNIDKKEIKNDNEDRNESKENDQKHNEKDKKKENVKNVSNKRKIVTNKTTTTADIDETSTKRLPKKKLKSAIVNLVPINEENEMNQKSRIKLRKLTMSNNNIINSSSNNNTEKCPAKNMKEDSEIDDSILKENKKSIITNQENSKEIQTKFFVTLDGVKNMFKGKKC